MNHTISIFRDRADRFSTILAGVNSRWDAPTPCTDWTAEDIVRHVIATERDFLARHDLGSPDATADLEPAQAWDQHRRSTLDILSRDGVADRAFDGHFGPTTIGDTLANFYGWDLAVHGWDIARATGQDGSITADEADNLARIAATWGEALHSVGVCGPARPVADDAGPVERLLAMVGRDPDWTD